MQYWSVATRGTGAIIKNANLSWGGAEISRTRERGTGEYEVDQK